MDVIRSSHLLKYDWPETCHRERDAFRVKKKNSPANSCGMLITTTHSLNFINLTITNYRIFGPLFEVIGRTSYTGPNYRTNTIIIVHLATLGVTMPR